MLFPNHILSDRLFRFEGEGGTGSGGEDPPKDPPKKDPPKKGDDQDPGPVPYERFKELNDKYKHIETQFNELIGKQKEAQETELKKKEEYKTLFEQKEAELAAERRNNLRMKIALEKGIPPELMDRIQGDDEEAMRTDADKLLKFVKPGSPGVPAPGDGQRKKSADLDKMSPKEIRENYLGMK